MVNSDDEHFARLRKAIDARDRFLAEHPELQPLQDEIARMMMKAGSPENRMAILEELLRAKTRELKRLLTDLSAQLTQENLQGHGSPAADPPRARGAGTQGGKVIGPAGDWPRSEPEDESAGEEEDPLSEN